MIKCKRRKTIKHARLIRILKENNYKDWLIVEAEQDPAKANPLKYAKIGFNYLEKVLRNCDYEIN